MNFTYKKGIYNTYTPGSGVGSTSISTRRAKLRLATSSSCYCGAIYNKLGQQTTTVKVNDKMIGDTNTLPPPPLLI